MRMDDQNAGQGSEGQPERQRVRVPLPPPVEWDNMPEQHQGAQASRREREAMMRELRGGANPTGPVPKTSPSRNVGRILRSLFVFALLGCLGYAAFFSARLFKSMGGGMHGAASNIGRLLNPPGEFPGQDRITVILICKDVKRHDTK